MRIAVFCLSFISFVALFLFTSSPVFAGHYIDNKDGTITAVDAAVMWQKADDGVERTWEDAVSYCDDLKLAGHDDWTLPTIQMLERLIDNSFSPTVDPVFSVRLSYYWSATEALDSVNSAKYINFFYGNTYSFLKDNTYYVICARDVSDTSKDEMRVRIAAESVTGDGPLAVQFSARVSGGTEPYFYEWDFGDGEFSSLSTPKHIFAGAGEYKVTLTISDTDGAAAVGEKVVKLGEEGLNVPSGEEELGNASSSKPSQGTSAGDNETALNKPLEEIKIPEKNTAVGAAAAGVGSTFEKGDGNATRTEDSSEDSSADNATVEKAPSGGDDNGTVTPPEVVSLGDNATVTPGSSPSPSDDGNGSRGLSLTMDANTTTVDGEREPAKAAAPDSSGEAAGAAPDSTFDSIEQDSSGLLKLFTSSPLPVALMPGAGEGVLAYSYGNGLRGDADWNKDSKVTARELKGYLGTAIDTLSQGKQKVVANMSGADFPVCSVSGATYIVAVGVDKMFEEGLPPLPFAADSATGMGKIISEKCQVWKQIVLTGQKSTRNNIIRAIVKTHELAGPLDTFIFYYAGLSEASEQGLHLFTYDTLAALPGLTGLDYDELAALLQDSRAGNIMMLFEVVSHDHR